MTIERNEIDVVNLVTEIKIPCIECCPQALVEQGLRGPGRGDCFCKIISKDCPFVITSNRGRNGQCVAPSAKVFRKYGLRTMKKNSTYLFGKSHFFFFLYFPEMNWQPPQHMPEFTRYGKPVDPTKERWTLSHCNGNHFDDSKNNLIWLLSSEHAIIEPNIARNTPMSLVDAGVILDAVPNIQHLAI